jgi:Fe-S cluster assembly ATP-binding protein
MDRPEKSETVLEIHDLVVSVQKKIILHNINLTIKRGENHILFGPNGSGKSSLLMAIMGNPLYHVQEGRILFLGADITHTPMHERAQRGLGIAFQRPPAVKGVKLSDLINSLSGTVNHRARDIIEKLHFTNFLERDINLGFSGGEIKRSEVLQLIIQDPVMALFDEPDSGVDFVNLRLLGEIINEFLERDAVPLLREKAALFITHSGYVMDSVEIDKGHLLIDGSLRFNGDPHELFERIKSQGFMNCLV